MKPLLVGEANPYGGDPYFALYPEPDGCAGQRLCKLVMQLDCSEYLARFDRVNLCPRTWSMKLARERASAYRVAELPERIVLLGAKVTRAFGFEYAPFTRRLSSRFVILPHPSGLSRAWYEPGAYERARSVLREAGVL
jgi:hypothetical protein